MKKERKEKKETPYNSNKCVALASSREELNHKLQLVLPVEEKKEIDDIVVEYCYLPRQVGIYRF